MCIHVILFYKLVLPEETRHIFKKYYEYIFLRQNPIVQIIYVTLVFVLFCLFQFYGINEHLPSEKIQIEYAYALYFLVGVSVLSFIYACNNEPGIIRTKNHQLKLNNYQFDNILYEKEDCKTCKFTKVARSKHCNVCNKCIEKFDHHCIWINQCVGAKNYKYFLLFISTHAVMCLYTSILGLFILNNFIEKKNLYNVKFM